MTEEVFLDYRLPGGLIAQRPAPEREGSRLMVVERAGGRISETVFSAFPGLLGRGDLLVVNDTRVVPARVTARKRDTGGKVEMLFLAWSGPRWEARVRGTVRPGTRLEVEGWPADLVAASCADGLLKVEAPVEGDPMAFFGRIGHAPLPPYIRRDGPAGEEDRLRYQTVYAREDGSVAAPTAGLHFSRALLDAVREAGAETAGVTLHVGWGTFSPVRGDWQDHRLHPEWACLEAGTAGRVNAALREGRRVVAVGTTSVRVLESAWDEGAGGVAPMEGPVDLYITPGFPFRVTRALLTNFHLPRSSLLLLVDAFAGSDLMRRAYARAIELGFRFFSYGDAMFIA